MTRAKTALIVGAGIGGLAAGLALQRAGWRVQIVERAESPRELGFALLLAPNAIRALRALGLAEAIIAGGVVASIGDMRRLDGEVLRRFDSRRVQELLGEPMVVVLRPVLHGALLDAVGRDAVLLGRHATSMNVVDSGVELMLENGETLAGDVLVGADGVRSVIRRLLHPGEPPPRPSGLFALRGVAYDVERHLAGMAGSQYFGRGIEAGLAQASASAVYWYMSLPAPRLPRSSDLAGLVQGITAGFEGRFRAIAGATRPEDMRLDELFDREPIEQWGRGRATLLGDAAHPMLPHAGQGAAQALEDGWALGLVLGGTADDDQALRTYERVRSARTAAIVRLARRNARMGAFTNPLACRVRDALLRHIPDRMIANMFAALNRPARMDQLT